MEKTPQNTFEQRKEELRQLIEVKKRSAIYVDQYEELFEQLNQYEDLIRERGIESLIPTEKNDYEKKKEKLATISIDIATIPELRFILEELGKSEEEIRENLAHENAHANVAHSLGANHEKYIVYFLKEGNIYQTRVTFPDNLSQEEVDYISSRAIQAPEEYGNAGGMSDDDKEQLENINQKKGSEDLPKDWDFIK